MVRLELGFLVSSSTVYCSHLCFADAVFKFQVDSEIVGFLGKMSAVQQQSHHGMQIFNACTSTAQNCTKQ